MQPGQNSQGANLDRTGRHELYVPEVGVVHGSYVRSPHGAGSGDQAGYTLFPQNIQDVLLLLARLHRLDGRPLHGSVCDGNGIDVRLAPIFSPIDEFFSI